MLDYKLLQRTKKVTKTNIFNYHTVTNYCNLLVERSAIFSLITIRYNVISQLYLNQFDQCSLYKYMQLNLVDLTCTVDQCLYINFFCLSYRRLQAHERQYFPMATLR